MANAEPKVRRALLATFSFPPDLNGVARASADWAEALLSGGWTVDIATAPSIQPRENQMWRGCRVYEFSLQNSSGQSERRNSQGEAYRDFLEWGHWDVIIFQGYLWPLRLALPLLPRLRARKILVSHGYAALRWFPVKNFPFGIGQWCRSALGSLRMLLWNRHIDQWVFLSRQRDLDAYFDHTMATLMRHPGVRVIPNSVALPINPSTGGTFRGKHGIPSGDPMVLCVGYYSRGKDQGFAARAFRRAGLAGATLVFIGTEFNEWSDRYRFLDEKIFAKTGVGRILWLEKVPREETLQAFQECDILVLSSYLETQPIVILEAMVRGKPWIARRAGCIPLVSGGVCVRSIREMARAMSLLALDINLRKTLGEKGRAIAKSEHSSQRFTESVLSLLEELTSPRR